MRDMLARTRLRDIFAAANRKAPPEFARDIQGWFHARFRGCTGKPRSPFQQEVSL